MEKQIYKDRKVVLLTNIVGFGAFGKHLRNVFPVMLGATLASLLNIWEINSPGMVLGILFSSTLALFQGNSDGFMVQMVSIKCTD